MYTVMNSWIVEAVLEQPCTAHKQTNNKRGLLPDITLQIDVIVHRHLCQAEQHVSLSGSRLE